MVLINNKVYGCTQFHLIVRLRQRGQAALTASMFFLVVSLAIIFGFSRLAVPQSNITKELINSKRSYAASESGIEDLVYREKNLMMSDNPEESYILKGVEKISVIKTVVLDEIKITATADSSDTVRRTQAAIKTPNGNVSFNYAVQAGHLGIRMKHNSEIEHGNVYSNGSIDGTGSAKIEGDIVIAAGSGNTVDQEQTSYNGGIDLRIRDVSERKYGAQSFIPSRTATPNKAEFYVANIGSPTKNLEIKIYSNNDNGTPNDISDDRPDTSAGTFGTAGGNNGIDAQSSGWTWGEYPNFGWYTVFFTNNTKPLFSGKKYWLVINKDSADQNQYWILGGNMNDSSYQNGTFLYSSSITQSAAWRKPNENSPDLNEPQGPLDIAFKVYLGEESTSIKGVDVSPASGGCDVGAGNVEAYAILDSDVAVKYAKCTDSTQTTFNSAGGCADSCAPYTYPPEITAPITEIMVDAWKQDIVNNCEPNGCINTTLTINGSTYNPYCLPNPDDCNEFGPTYINGNLNISNSAIVIFNGPVYVTGNAIFTDDCDIQTGISGKSEKLIADGYIEVKNKCVILGSEDGNEDYLMLLSTAYTMNNPAAVTIRDRAKGALLYALNGGVEIVNKAELKSVFGHHILIQDDAEVEYEQGLASLEFNTGPAGTFDIKSWQEIE